MTKTVRVAMVSVWCVSAAFAAPKVRIEPVALDFGTVKAGAQADRVLEVHNDGDAPLRVLRAKGSCGCTRVDLPEGGAAEVAPGGAMHLTVRFDSAGRAGKQSSVAAITTNDPERPAVTVPITASSKR